VGSADQSGATPRPLQTVRAPLALPPGSTELVEVPDQRIRPHPKRVYALKGLYILAQGNALGHTETNTSALKGRDIGYTLVCGPYIPPFQG
jgi:hypothetical protein